jgi:RNA polymerase sigma-70 factor, ECF subfamily
MVVVNLDLEELSRRQSRGCRNWRISGEVRHCPVQEHGGDRELTHALTAARNGDADAQRYLYDRYSVRVRAYLTGLLKDEDEAQDLAQIVFVRLFAKLHLYRPAEAPFHAWLLRIARNLAYDHMRRRRPIPVEEFPELEAPTDDHAVRDRSRSLRDAFSALPTDQRSVAWRRHVLGFSPTEIAQQLGRSEASIHGLHNRARTALKAQLIARECVPSVVA